MDATTLYLLANIVTDPPLCLQISYCLTRMTTYFLRRAA